MFLLLLPSMLGPVEDSAQHQVAELRAAHREEKGETPLGVVCPSAPPPRGPGVIPSILGQNDLEVSSRLCFPGALTSADRTGFSTLTSAKQM